MGASLIGPAISAGSSLIGGKKSKKSAAAAQQQAEEAQRRAAEQQQQWARENATWANDQNKANADTEYAKNWEGAEQALGMNRADQSSDFGNLTWDQDPTTGEWKQTIGVSDADRGTLDALRGKREEMVGGLGGGFDVQGDVMNAYRDLQNPLLQESRDKENARLAAMGLSTGSGSAWNTAQRSLNDAQTRADQNAILQGFNADQALRQSNRADLGVTESMMGGLQNRTQMPTYAQFGKPTYDIPTISTPGAPSYDPNSAIQAGQVAGAGTQTGWNSFGSGLGKLGESAWNAWGNNSTQQPSQPEQLSGPGADSWWAQ